MTDDQADIVVDQGHQGHQGHQGNTTATATAASPSSLNSNSTTVDTNTEMNTEMNDNDNGSDNGSDDNVNDKRIAVLRNTRYLAMHMLFIMGVTAYCDTNIDSIWSLYAITFGATEADIGWIFFGYYLMSGLGQLSLAWVGDKYGFDRVLTLNFILSSPMLLLQGFATNLQQLIAGRLLASFFTPDTSLMLGYISKYMPTEEYQSKYDGYLNAIIMLVFVLGSFTSGIISSLANYSANFWTVGALAICAFFYSMNFIFNKQQNIEDAQKEYCAELLSKSKSKSKSKSTQRQNAGHTHTDTDTDTEKHMHYFPIMAVVNADADADEDESKTDIRNKAQTQKTAKTTPVFQWVMICLMVAHSFFFWGAIHIISSYYTLYMHKKFNASVFISTLQLAADGILIIIGALITPKYIIQQLHGLAWFGMNQNEQNVLPEYLSVLIPLIVFQISMAFCPLITDMNVYWFVAPFAGLLFGIIGVGELALLQTMQPHRHSGKIGGTFLAAMQIGAAVSALLVGEFWHLDIEWFWYWFLIFAFWSMVAVIVAGIINRIKMGAFARVQ